MKPPVSARGFSLIELMVTITVIAVLLILGAPSFGSSAATARERSVVQKFTQDFDWARGAAGVSTVTMTLTAACTWSTTVNGVVDAAHFDDGRDALGAQSAGLACSAGTLALPATFVFTSFAGLRDAQRQPDLHRQQRPAVAAAGAVLGLDHPRQGGLVNPARAARGFTLLSVLVAVVVFAFGLLGLGKAYVAITAAGTQNQNLSALASQSNAFWGVVQANASMLTGSPALERQLHQRQHHRRAGGPCSPGCGSCWTALRPPPCRKAA